MSITSEGLRPARRRERRRLETLSVSELCAEIREAPSFDAAAGISTQTLASAYERLRAGSLELAAWTVGEPQKCSKRKGGRES